MSENLTEAEVIERLEAELQRMPKLQREIFLAIRLEDASYSEIAERTGLSVQKVERYFAQSLVTLLDAVDGRPPELGGSALCAGSPRSFGDEYRGPRRLGRRGCPKQL